MSRVWFTQNTIYDLRRSKAFRFASIQLHHSKLQLGGWLIQTCDEKDGEYWKWIHSTLKIDTNNWYSSLTCMPSESFVNRTISDAQNVFHGASSICLGANHSIVDIVEQFVDLLIYSSSVIVWTVIDTDNTQIILFKYRLGCLLRLVARQHKIHCMHLFRYKWDKRWLRLNFSPKEKSRINLPRSNCSSAHKRFKVRRLTIAIQIIPCYWLFSRNIIHNNDYFVYRRFQLPWLWNRAFGSLRIQINHPIALQSDSTQMLCSL